jgi:hypothetical protein
MITFYVGNAHLQVDCVLDYGTTWSAMLPREQVRAFAGFLDGCVDDITVRVYSDAVINWVGEQIEESTINFKEVQVVTERNTHGFDEKGCLIDWPYGIFNY